MIIDKSSSKNVYRKVKQVLRSHYSKLMESTNNCLLEVASQLYSKNLITKQVIHSPTFGKIEIDFSAMVSVYQGDTKKMMEVCSLFIECLSTAGGPAQEEAMALARDWEKEVFKDQVSFSLTNIVTKFFPKEVQLSSNDNLAIDLRNLHKKYAKLITDIITYYASSGKHDAIIIARWVQSAFDETGLAHENVTVDEIFNRMQPHHSFIDIDAINDLIEDYPIDDTALQARFDKYSDDVNKFIDSVKLDDMVTTIKGAIIGESTKVDPKIILKLSGKWNDKTIGQLRKLMKYLFDEEAKYVTIKKFLKGSICIRFLVASNRLVQSLNAKFRAKFHFLHLLGIFQLIIDNQIIIDKEEDINFTFEESLLQSIASIESHPEYYRLLLLLIELKINLNYQSFSGKTALMSASVGGHIEILKLLLQNGANPFVKLQIEGFIGLNSLACTALCQHIYKSIGGVKIIPQDDTSVENMLEMAVKERGVSSHFYDSFTHFVDNYVKKRFWSLQFCFHALSTNFIDAAMNNLTSRAMVAEAKQKFHSYIKRDAICENAHQLVQLLQPHCSSFHINLFTIACTLLPVSIKEQVEDYSAKLKIFKDTTSLFELATMTKGLHYPYGMHYSTVILRLNKSWGSRTITDLNQMENFCFFTSSSFMTLLKINCDFSSLMCTYIIPQLQIETLVEAVNESKVSLYKIGVFEVILNNIPLMVEEEKKTFTFEAALQEAHQNNRYVLLFFLGLNNNLFFQNNGLIIASGRGDFMNVQYLLSKEPNINFQNNNGWTALMAASDSGHHQIVELLLNNDPDMNIQNRQGMTALMFASAKGLYQVVESLLSKDPDINIQNSVGLTALMFVSIYGHHQIAELLLNKDPNINIQSTDGLTALMFGSISGHIEIVKCLLNRNPDVNIENNDKQTALMHASSNGHHQIVELLLNKGSNINTQSNKGMTALMFASGQGYHQVVKLLLNENPDIDIQNIVGLTSLMFASASGHHEVVKLILNKDPDIDIQNDDGWTVLMYASNHGHGQVVELLMNKDPNINIQSSDGLTALMFASGKGHLQVVNFLLSKDPDINIQSNAGLTALMFASASGYHQVVELLLNKDTDINIQSNDGWTSLMYASHHGHHQVVELLLDKDPVIDTQNKIGWTALMNASNNGHQQVVELLLSKNQNINLQNNIRWTALMLSAVGGCCEVVELLLGKDADINIQSIEGYSAFTFILACSTFSFEVLGIPLKLHTRCMNQLHSGNYRRILKLMLNSHPNHIHTMNDGNYHSLAVAALFNNFDAVVILMEKCEITSKNIFSAFNLACYLCHSSMMIFLSEKINLSTNERKLLVAAAEGDLQMLNSIIHDLGMSPDTPLVAGVTPLMIAASSGHIKIVDALLQAGADVGKTNNEGVNALNIVSDITLFDRVDIKQLLITNTPTGPNSILNNTSTVTKSVFSILGSFNKISCNPYYAKQEEMKTLSGVFDIASTNMAQFVS